MTEQGEMTDTQTVFNVDVKRKSSSGKICIENVPPEEMLLSKRCKNIADAPFVAHRIKKTVSDLIGEGYDRKKIEDIPSYANSTWNEETLSRNLFDEESYMDETLTHPCVKYYILNVICAPTLIMMVLLN